MAIREPDMSGMMDDTTSMDAAAPSGRIDGSTASTEAALIDASLAGDGRAFATLVKPHLQLLYRVAHRACGDSSLAEDAVQETLAIAFRGLRRYRPGTSFRAYLAAIAVKRAHTLLRSEVRRTRYESGADAPHDAVRADAILEADETATRIREALSALPGKRRAAALLRLDAGLSYADISRALHMSEGSARVHVHLAVKALRQHLEDLLNQETPGQATNRAAKKTATR